MGNDRTNPPAGTEWQAGYVRDAGDGTLIFKLATNVTLAGNDIELGGVEIKDGATDQRASVNAAGALASRIEDSASGAQVLSAAPGSDTGQRGLAVRVISQLGAGAGGAGADPLSDGTDAGALPTKTLWVAGADGTVLRGLRVDSSGRARTVVENTVTADTELPAAAALADNTGNPTAPAVGAFPHGYDGAAWDRLRTYAGSVNGNFDGVLGVIAYLWDGGVARVAEPANADAKAFANIPAAGVMVYNGASMDRVRGDTANGMDVDVTRSALPTGAATETTLAALKALFPAAFTAGGGLKVGLVDAIAALTDGTQKAINRGGAKGATTASDVTSTAEGADHQALDNQNYHGGVAIDPRDVSDRAGRALGAVTNPTQLPAALEDGRLPTREELTALWVTGTAATGVALTVTLPAGGAGLFHVITFLEITVYATAARTGGATPIVVTTTNLPGSPAFTFGTAQAIGATDRQLVQPGPNGIKSSAANTATTIVAPVATTGIWRINVGYYLST